MADSLTRREFAGRVAAGSVLAGASGVVAEESGEKKTAPTAKSSPVSPVELVVELVREKYPDPRLDEAALDEVRSDVRHFVGRSRILSSFDLANSDEPGFVFAAWRSEPPVA